MSTSRQWADATPAADKSLCPKCQGPRGDRNFELCLSCRKNRSVVKEEKIEPSRPSPSRDRAEYLRHKPFTCPHCGQEATVEIAISVGDVKPYAYDSETPEYNWKDTLTGQENEVLSQAETYGILAAFDQAVSRLPANSRPKNSAKFFLAFLKTATQKKVPQFVLDAINAEFGWKQVRIVGANGILCAILGGEIRLFFPLVLAAGAPVRSITSGNLKGRIPADEGGIGEWVRTRYGYVIGNGAFFDAMRKRSLGEFAKPGF